jgi:hypothetical protein
MSRQNENQKYLLCAAEAVAERFRPCDVSSICPRTVSRCKFLKPGTGRAAIVLPDGILTNASLQGVL